MKGKYIMKSIKDNEYLLFKNKKDWKKHTEKVSGENMYTISRGGEISKDDKPEDFPAFFKLTSDGTSYLPIEEEEFAEALDEELKNAKVVIKKLKKIRDKYDLDIENYEAEDIPFADETREDWDMDDDDTDFNADDEREDDDDKEDEADFWGHTSIED